MSRSFKKEGIRKEDRGKGQRAEGRGQKSEGRGQEIKEEKG